MVSISSFVLDNTEWLVEWLYKVDFVLIFEAFLAAECREM